jgi:hypothetical protein
MALPMVDPSAFPVGGDVLVALAVAWILLRVGIAWVWLRRRGHLERVANAVPVLG